MAIEKVQYKISLKDELTPKLQKALGVVNKLQAALKSTNLSARQSSQSFRGAAASIVSGFNSATNSVKKLSNEIRNARVTAIQTGSQMRTALNVRGGIGVGGSPQGGGMMGGIGALAGRAFAAVGIYELGKGIFEAGSNMEQLNISLETMLGNKDKSDRLIGQIKTLALKTPFEIEEVGKATKSLLAYGISAEDVIGDLKSLGNIAAGVGTDKLDQLILAFGQTKAATKLTGNELRQFTEAGVPLIGALAAKFKTTEANVIDLVHAGKVGFRDVRDALAGMSKEGGKFFNLMEKQSKSTSGLISNLGDAFKGLGTTIFNVMKPVIDWLVAYLTKAINGLQLLISGDFFSERGRLQQKLLASRSETDQKVMSAGFDARKFKDKNEALAEFIQLSNAVGENKIESVLKSGNLSEQGKSILESFKSKGNGTATGLGLLDSSELGSSGGGIGSSTDISSVESRQPKNIYINITKLVESLNISATNLKDSSSRIKDEVTKVLLSAVNDVNLAHG